MTTASKSPLATMLSSTKHSMRQADCCHNNKYKNMCQPGLGACGASLSLPGRLILSDLIGAENGQMVLLTVVRNASFSSLLARASHETVA